VRSNDHRTAALAQLFDEFPQVAPRLRVQARSGFIEEDDLRLVDERRGY
jgi:hypothetical protein